MGAIVTRLFGNWNTVLVGTICGLCVPVTDMDVETSTHRISSTSPPCIYLAECEGTFSHSRETKILTFI